MVVQGLVQTFLKPLDLICLNLVAKSELVMETGN